MIISPQDIQPLLETLCQQVALVHSNDSQCMFSLSPQAEAQLAYDVLSAHGFVTRIYHEEDISKFYVTLNAPDAKPDLAGAMQYAATLKQLLDVMEQSGTEEYVVSFTNSPGAGKQISIHLSSPVQTPISITPGATAAVPRPRPMPPKAPPGRRVKMRRKKSAVFGAQPQITKESIFATTNEKPGMSTWLSTYVFSNFSQSFYAFVISLFIVLIVFSMLITIRGFACPDLATVKSKEWYCK